MLTFEGYTTLVTGAASGIGLEVARRFADLGATVVAVDRNDPATALPEALSLQADVSSPHDAERMVEFAVSRTGRLDILCNNAGIASTTDVVTCSPQEWDEVFAVNVRGVFLATKYALPHMLRRGRGVIVNTASAAGMVGLPDRAAYCASKGAVIALTRQVAIQYVRQNIRCNCVCPGTVDTPWVERLLAQADDPVAMRQALADRQPVGRLATAGEIADAIIFLASPASSYLTGVALPVDGGLTAA